MAAIAVQNIKSNYLRNNLDREGLFEINKNSFKTLRGVSGEEKSKRKTSDENPRLLGFLAFVVL